MHTPPRKHVGPTAGTILCILAAAALWLGFRLFLNTDGGSSGAYDSYQGPILPLTAISGGEWLEAERQVTFDFAPYREPSQRALTPNSVVVTDGYTLKNPSGDPVKAILAYPFEGQFIDERDLIPTLTLDGQPIEAKLYPAVDAREEIFQADSFDEYQTLMEANDYFAQAMETPLLDNTPVKVYRFTDISYHGDSAETDIFLTMDFTLPEGATAWVLRYHFMRQEEGKHTVWFREDQDDQDMAWLLVQNGDVENLTFGGNLGHHVTETSATQEITCEYETYESTLLEMVSQFAQTYDFWSAVPNYPDPGLVTPEMLYRGAIGRLAEQNFATGYVHYLEDVFYQTVVNIRLMYWVFTMDIPANSSVELTAAYRQEASTDIGGPQKAREGYDLATKLGSSLKFTNLEASLKNEDLVQISRQNFGFDPAKGITQVRLDLETERYYLEVMPAQQ